MYYKSDKATIAEAQAGTDDSKWISPSVLPNAVKAFGSRIQYGYYSGTGLYGPSNPCTIVCDFVPKFIWMFSKVPFNSQVGLQSSFMLWINGSHDVYNIIWTDALQTSYQSAIGFAEETGNWPADKMLLRTYAKKSTDGKTISWYIDDTNIQITGEGPTNAQLNVQYTKYYWVAFS